MDQIIGAVDKKRAKAAVVRGQEGEDWVKDALLEAFPDINGSQVFLTRQPHCGDIVLRLESGMTIMFEVKNYTASPVKNMGGQGGQQLAKFFSDAEQTRLGYR